MANVPNTSKDVSPRDRTSGPLVVNMTMTVELGLKARLIEEETINKKREDKNMKKYTMIAAAAVAGLTLSAGSSYGQLVQNNNVNNTPTQTTSVYAGPTLQTQNPSFNNGPQQGNLQSEVIASGAITPNAGGSAYNGLIFGFQVSEAANSGDFIDTLSLSGFNLGSVWIETTGLGSAGDPTTYNLFHGVLTVDFNPDGVLQGTSSAWIYVFTTANFFGVNNASVTDGVSANTTDLAPVPEANTIVAGALMLLPLGIGAVRAIRKERTA